MLDSVFIPMSVCPLSPAPGVGRLVPLCQEGVAGAVRGQQLSEVWTVGYALDLLLQGGLLPEATWLAHRLGDWKTAVSLGLAYTTYSTEHCNFTGSVCVCLYVLELPAHQFPTETCMWIVMIKSMSFCEFLMVVCCHLRLRWRELHLPAALEPVSLFQGQLESLLGRKARSEETQGDEESYKSFTGVLCLTGDLCSSILQYSLPPHLCLYRSYALFYFPRLYHSHLSLSLFQTLWKVRTWSCCRVPCRRS